MTMIMMYDEIGSDSFFVEFMEAGVFFRFKDGFSTGEYCSEIRVEFPDPVRAANYFESVLNVKPVRTERGYHISPSTPEGIRLYRMVLPDTDSSISEESPLLRPFTRYEFENKHSYGIVSFVNNNLKGELEGIGGYSD